MVSMIMLMTLQDGVLPKCHFDLQKKGWCVIGFSIVNLGGYGIRYCSTLKLRGYGISGGDWLDF